MRFLGLGNGKDGVIALGSYTPLKYTCSGTSGTTSLTATGTFSAGDRLFIHQSRGTGVGAYEDNRVASYVAGTITLVHPLENTYTDSGASQAQVLVVKEASSVTGSLTVPTWDGDVGGGFVIACSGVFDGIITGTGIGYRGGVGTSVSTRSGEGSVGASASQTTANGNGGGGGAADASGPGGGGGGSLGTVGTIGEAGIGGATPGAIGSLVGQAEITTLFKGGGGGSGGSPNTTDWFPGGNGGAGGGFCVIYTNTISASTSITLKGSNGSKSVETGGGSGAGGAGGSCLVKCVKNLGFTFSATGGTGGTRSTEGGGDYGGAGGNGGKGRLRIETCSNTTGTEDPTASTSIGGHNYCGILGGMI